MGGWGVEMGLEEGRRVWIQATISADLCLTMAICISEVQKSPGVGLHAAFQCWRQPLYVQVQGQWSPSLDWGCRVLQSTIYLDKSQRDWWDRCLVIFDLNINITNAGNVRMEVTVSTHILLPFYKLSVYWCEKFLTNFMTSFDLAPVQKEQ